MPRPTAPKKMIGLRWKVSRNFSVTTSMNDTGRREKPNFERPVCLAW